MSEETNMNPFELLRYMFEKNGFCYFHNFPVCGIFHDSEEFLQSVVKNCNFGFKVKKDVKHNNYKFTLSGNYVIDFLDMLYSNEEHVCKYNKRKYRFYKMVSTKASFRYIKADSEAKAPKKTRISDSGYDLALIKKIKTNGAVEFYDTGIIVQPPFGYYFDLVPRSSISKSGYILANSVGVIDRTYQGTIIVPLIKLDITKPDLELPCTLVQIIPRKIEHLKVIEIVEEELLDSERKTGGFGSTN